MDGFMVSGLLYYFGYANLTPMGMITNTYLMIFLNGLVFNSWCMVNTYTSRGFRESKIIITTTIYL
jgi:hypothetical protein